MDVIIMRKTRKNSLLRTFALFIAGACTACNSFRPNSITPTPPSDTTSKNKLDPIVDHDVIIVGGGIVGLAVSCGLVGRNIQNVRVFEKATELKPIGALLGLFPNGLTALRRISPSVADQILNLGLPYKGNIRYDFQRREDGFDYHDDEEAADGNEKAIIVRKIQEPAPPAMKDKTILLVWYFLQETMAKALPDGMLCLGKLFESYTVDSETGIVSVSVRDRSSNTTTIATCRILVGADGIRSKVRKQFCKDHPTSGNRDAITYHSRVMYRALMDMDEVFDDNARAAATAATTTTTNSTFQPPPEGYTVSYRCGEAGRVFAFRESARGILTFTATVVVPEEPNFAFLSTKGGKKERLKEAFYQYPIQVQRIMDQVKEASIYENAVYDIDEVLAEWSHGPIILVGDSAHTVTPAYGQGANIGLESACDLVDAISTKLTTPSNKNGQLQICATLDEISKCLNDVWQGRIHRIREIHDFSRRRALRRNVEPANKAAQHDPGLEGDDRSDEGKFYERLYSWMPMAERHTKDQ